MNCVACKIETWHTHGQWEDVSCLPELVCNVASYLSLYFFIFLSSFQILKLLSVFSGTTCMRPRKLKLNTNMNSGLMYCVYWNWAAAYLSLYLYPLPESFRGVYCFQHVCDCDSVNNLGVYNLDSFCPFLFKFTPHLNHQTMHVG